MNENRLNSVELLAKNIILYKTDYFDVSVTIPARFVDSWEEGYLSLDYDVIRRTTYATNFQIKKFIKRSFMKMLVDYIRTLDKGFRHGRV